MSDHSGQPGLKWPLRIHTERRRDGVLVLAAAGRLGHAAADELEAALERAIGRDDRGMVLDFAQVDYVSSAGLTAIDAAAARLAEGQGILVLCAVTEPVRIALDLAGLLPRLVLEPSLDRAAARITSRTDALEQ